MKKTILLVLETTHGQIGGTEQNSLRFAQALKTRGFFPHIAEIGKSILHKSPDAAGLTIHTITASHFSDISINTWRSLLKSIKPSTIVRSKTWIGCINWKLDIIAFFSSASYLSWEHHPAADISDFRAACPNSTPNIFKETKIKAKSFLRNILHMRTPSRTLCVSDAVFQPIVQQHRISLKKIKTIYPGVNFNTFRRIDLARTEIRKEWEVPETGFVIGSLGRLVAHKGNDFTLIIMAELRKKFPQLDIWCVFAGQGPDLERLRCLAEELNIIERVRFPGWQVNAPKSWNGFDLFVMPSSDEGLGMTIIEAISSGCLAISANVGGMKEVLCGPLQHYCLPARDIGAWTEKIASIASMQPMIRMQLHALAYETAKKNFDADHQWNLMVDWLAESKNERARSKPSKKNLLELTKKH